MEPEAILPERFVASFEDGDIAGWRWRREGALRVLFLHATGFCASAYKQMLGRLAERFDVFAIDQRGHGRTTLPANPDALRSWRPYANDVCRFLDASPGPWRLAGHSMGAVVALLAAERRTDIVDLALIEPVVMSAPLTLAAHTPLWSLFAPHIPIARQAARRRDHWSSREEVFDRYAGKALFSRWQAGALADYLEDGLTQSPDGGVALACSPAWEAATFSAQANNFWAAASMQVRRLRVAVANHPSTTCGGLACMGIRAIGAPVEAIADVTHLAPMEKPAAIAQFSAGGREQS